VKTVAVFSPCRKTRFAQEVRHSC